MKKEADRTLTREQEKALEQAGSMRRGIVARAFAGTASPRQAIKAKCLECVCYELPVENIGGCTITRCPLWLYRPYQPGEDESGEE
jgi:hypothetical protein